jgi:hypothetical protein
VISVSVSHRELIWELLVNPECGEPLLAEARKIVSHNSESLYLHSGDHANFITYLLDAGMKNKK